MPRGHCCFLPSLFMPLLGVRSNENEARVKIRAQQRTVGAAARKNVLLSRPCVLIFASLRIWVDLVKSSERRISTDSTRTLRRLAFYADFICMESVDLEMNRGEM